MGVIVAQYYRDPGTGNFVLIPGSDSVSVPNEVAVQTSQPTDPNVEIWVDPNGTWADEFASKAYVDGGGWIAPTLLNSWVNYGAPFATAGYTKVGPVVYLKGLVKTGAQGTTIFTLPGGYRPLEQHIIPVISNQLIGRMDIYTNGNVYCSLGASAWFSITCSFVAES